MLIENIRTAVEKYGMLYNGDTIFTGFSGGADSTALLLALLELEDELEISVNAIHINHMLRGEESVRDENFCRDLCKRLGIPIDVITVNVKEYAGKNGFSIEEAARILRYKTFEEIAAGNKISTAHTLNDSAETIVFNLCRGTGLKGLLGIPPVRGNIIRPLIMCTRNDVEMYLNDKGQNYITDSTNLTEDYTRNKIRHSVIPILEGINGGFHENIANMINTLSCENDYIESETFKCSEEDLRMLHTALRRRVIINEFKAYNINISADMVKRTEEHILSGNNVKVNIKKDIYAFISDGKLRLERSSSDRFIFKPLKIKIGENQFLSDKSVMISLNNGENINGDSIVNNNLTIDRLDYDKIQGDILLRNRRNGDSFIRCGRDFTSSLKKLFNSNIPLINRDYIAILEDGNGIIWVEGFGIADRVKICKSTKRIFSVSVKLINRKSK